MTGQPGRSGGARTAAGRPPGTGGTPGAGRPPGATDVTLSPARLLTPGQKWKFAEKAVQYADQMLQVLVDIALNGESVSWLPTKSSIAPWAKPRSTSTSLHCTCTRTTATTGLSCHLISLILKTTTPQ